MIWIRIALLCKHSYSIGGNENIKLYNCMENYNINVITNKLHYMCVHEKIDSNLVSRLPLKFPIRHLTEKHSKVESRDFLLIQSNGKSDI
jgi:hypothetical protein